jgi:hypothetical protein
VRVKPVFVDRTGQRRRVVRVAGAAAGLALALASLLLVAGFTGAGPGHLPLLPQPAGGGAPAAPRSPTTTRPAPPSTRPPVTRPATIAPPAATTAAPEATPTPAPSRSGHRRIPTHTPGNNKPSKPS